MEIFLIIVVLFVIALFSNIFNIYNRLGQTILAPAIAFIAGNALFIMAGMFILHFIFFFTDINGHIILVASLIIISISYVVFFIEAKQKTNKIQATIKVATANIFAHNKEAKKFASELKSEKPDIIFFQEYDSRVWRDIYEVIGENYPYTVSSVLDDENYIAIYSKYPLENIKQFGDQFMSADIYINDELITLVGVHQTSPTDAKRFTLWSQSFATLSRIVSDSESRKIIVAGDFNATIGHYPFRQFVLNNNFKDMAFGLLTWTFKKGTFPAFMGLDHILVSEHFEKVKSYTLAGSGSDHLPVYAVIDLK